ncbi:MAG: DUF2188 domain-containing protein [Phenylobacterium zucineum]|nr:MAG: DUF2188 domain-containing protein [Phenylobacterium zucineum]
MAQVEYSVELRDGTWQVGLNGKFFGPYSTIDAAVVAATGAARKAEAQGYEAIVRIEAPPEAGAAA